MTTKRIPITIGNQTAIIEREEPDTCSAPWCRGEVEHECDYPVKVDSIVHRHCGAKLCAKHARRASGGNLVTCPSHARLLEAKRMGGA